MPQHLLVTPVPQTPFKTRLNGTKQACQFASGLHLAPLGPEVVRNGPQELVLTSLRAALASTGISLRTYD